MKKILMFLFAMFICVGAIAHTINWYANGQVVSTTSCQSGDNITPPTAPAKTGYHFVRWGSVYTKLEYLESTGTQYIDTNLTTNQGDISYALVFMPTEMPETGYYGILGVDNNYQAGYSPSGQAHIGYTATTDVFYSVNTKATVSGVLSQTTPNGVYYVNGVNTGLTRALAINESAYLFSAGADAHVVKGKLYSFSATRSGNTIMNLIPAKRNTDNALGMYDTVSGQFFTNAGTGAFIAGPEVGGL